MRQCTATDKKERMIQIARSEKDPKMRQRIVERLVNMKSPEATDYLLEILNK